MAHQHPLLGASSSVFELLRVPSKTLERLEADYFERLPTTSSTIEHPPSRSVSTEIRSDAITFVELFRRSLVN